MDGLLNKNRIQACRTEVSICEIGDAEGPIIDLTTFNNKECLENWSYEAWNVEQIKNGFQKGDLA